MIKPLPSSSSTNGEGADDTIGLMLSGGLDSAILLGQLLKQRDRVRPFYVRTGCVWQQQESRAVADLLAAMKHPKLDDLVELDLPVADLYADHWSMTGRAVPDQFSRDEAVHLPGRNPLLLLKPALWCVIHDIPELALGTLAANPFADATPEFFSRFEAMIAQATGGRVRILRPFAKMSKRDVMQLGRDLPLNLTFSCLAPVRGQHCGKCNKCAERAAAFGFLSANDHPAAKPVTEESPRSSSTAISRG